MSTFFNRLKKLLLLRFLFGFLFIFFLGFSLKSIGENLSNALSNSAHYKDRAWYVIELGNVPVGTAIVSRNNKAQILPYDYHIQFTSRVGISPITYEIYAQAQKSNDVLDNTQIVQNFLSHAQSTDSSKTDSNEQNKYLVEKEETFLTKKKSFFIEDDQHSSFNDVLEPFPSHFLKVEDSFKATYSKDKFLQIGIVTLAGDVSLKFKRVDEKKYNEEIKQISRQRVDLGIVNNLQNGKNEMENLFKKLTACQSEMQNLNKSILKQMPHESYLMYRRIINLSHFCTKLDNALNAAEEDDDEEKFTIIANHVKKLLTENASELPHAISQFPDKTIYYNSGVSFLWPRMTTFLIQNSLNEILNLYSLDLNRKSLLTIQLRIAKMQPKAVVRADIVQINSPMSFSIQTSTTHPSSPYYLNALAFAANPDRELGEICKKNAGNVGIDFDNVSKSVVSSTGIRGVWDLQTKLTTARMFAIRSTLEKSCDNIYFRGDPAIERFLKQEIDTFKNESLSLENTLLLSNYGHKKLWVMPGKYRITVSSIINEKVISVQEFVVGENTQTNVIANVH